MLDIGMGGGRTTQHFLPLVGEYIGIDYAPADESHNFRLQTYYIRPETQVEQLAFGFDTVEIYPWTQHTHVNFLGEGGLDSDLWLYYFYRLN